MDYRSLIISLCAALFAILPMILNDLLAIKRKVRNINPVKDYSRSFEIITSGFERKTIQDKNDLYFIYETIVNPSDSFASYLKHYLVFLRTKEAETSISSDLFNNINNTIKGYIDEEESNTSFDTVPDPERRVLLSVREALPNQDKKKLYELADLVIDRERSLNRARRNNYWSIPLSVIGCVLTALFGFGVL